jgi:hypothetical protein
VNTVTGEHEVPCQDSSLFGSPRNDWVVVGPDGAQSNLDSGGAQLDGRAMLSRAVARELGQDEVHLGDIP